jgi:hypothetical protein
VFQPCGVDYELSTYVADGPDDKPHKRNSVQLAIRKLTYAPEEPAPQPSAEVTKEFLMSPGNLRLEATLDKEVCLLLYLLSRKTTGQKDCVNLLWPTSGIIKFETCV